jgi:hypothetical protein
VRSESVEILRVLHGAQTARNLTGQSRLHAVKRGLEGKSLEQPALKCHPVDKDSGSTSPPRATISDPAATFHCRGLNSHKASTGRGLGSLKATGRQLAQEEVLAKFLALRDFDMLAQTHRRSATCRCCCSADSSSLTAFSRTWWRCSFRCSIRCLISLPLFSSSDNSSFRPSTRTGSFAATDQIIYVVV